MATVDVAFQKARTRLQAAERERDATDSVAVAAEERSQRAWLTLKEAKKDFKKADQAARKARKAAKVARKAFSKARKRARKKEERVAETTNRRRGTGKRPVAERSGPATRTA
jgi:hypothetical protein